MADWYCSSVAYTAVAQWAASHTYAVGAIVRQLATPTVGNERCFRVSAITTGVSGGTEPTWTLTKAGTTTDSGVTWTECTGNSGQQQNGGVTNTWTAPHALIQNMCSWMANGDRGFVSSDHTQTTTGSLTLTSPGVLSSFFSVNRTTGSIPPAAGDITNGAAANVTSSGIVALGVAGGGFWQGFTFTRGTGSDANGNLNVGSGSANSYYMKNCSFVLGGTGAMSIVFGQTNVSKIVLDNPTFQFAAVGHFIQILDAYVTLVGGSVSGATIPTTLITSTNMLGALDARGFDFSSLTSGKTILGAGISSIFMATLSNCKLSATLSIIGGSPTAPDDFKLDVVNCDSAATGYRNERHRYQGDLTTETTITRTGGASDGVQKVSHKVVTTANASINNPFECFPLFIWNPTTGSSKTLTIEFISSGTLNNDDIWVEVDYLGSSSTPIASFVNNTITTRLTTHAAQTSSAAGWDSSPATPVTQKLTVSFTAQLAGLVRAQVKVAKASTTVYVDPLITLT